MRELLDLGWKPEELGFVWYLIALMGRYGTRLHRLVSVWEVGAIGENHEVYIRLD